MTGNIDTIKDLILANNNFKTSRLQSLYSNFVNLRETNVEGYKANISSWKGFLTDLMNNHADLLQQRGKISLSSNNLQQLLTFSTGSLTYKPKGLDKVIDSMINEDHTVVPLSAFKQKPVDIDGNGDGIIRSLLMTILPSSYCNHLTNFHSSTENDTGSLKPNEKYVFLQNLNQESKSLESLLDNLNTPLLVQHLSSLAASSCGITSKTDFDCCLLYLKRDKKSITVSNDGVVCLKSSKLHNSPKLMEMDPKDLKAIADLNYAVYSLQSYCDRLGVKISSLDDIILKLVTEKHISMAKSQLRIKKVMEKHLESNQQKLEQLQVVKMKLQESQNNIVAVKTLKTNADMLKKLNSEMPEEENLDELWDSLGEEINTTNEVSEKLGALNAEISDEDIEDELNAMEKQENAKTETKRKEDEKDVKTTAGSDVAKLEERFKNLAPPSVPEPKGKTSKQNIKVKQPLEA